MNMDGTVPISPWWTRLCRWLWEQRGLFWGTVVFGVALNIFAAWLILPWGQSFTATPLGVLLAHPWIYLPVGICLLLLTALVGSLAREPSAAVASPALSSKNRAALRQMLSKEYHRQLNQTLPGATMLALGLYERTDLTRSPTQLVFRRTSEENPLPPDTSIVQVYDDAGQGLLILGEPGAGKTTLLLDLAQELLRRAETNEDQPLAFILNISSWGKTRSALSTWLIEELSRAYDIPRALGTILLGSDQLLLLLDGLDEVTSTARAACIEAINSYKGTHFGPIVVCSRSREYLEQQARLTVPTAVVVQPLSSEQVITYLNRLGESLVAVREVLQTNLVLAQLLTTPLLLNVVILAYRGKSVKDLPQLGSAEEQQQEIFQRYVTRMLEQRSEPMLYPAQQMRHWLSWLAQQMKQSSQSVHYIEHLQPDWLTSRQAGWYTWLGKYVPGILIGFLISMSLMTLLFSLQFAVADRLRDGVFGGLCGGLLSSLVFVSPISQLQPAKAWRTRARQTLSKLLLGGSIGAGIGLLCFLIYSIYSIYAIHSVYPVYPSPLVSGVYSGLGSFLLCLIFPWRQHKPPWIFSRRFTSTKFAQATGVHIRDGLRIGLIIGLIVGLSAGLNNILGYALSYGFLGIVLSLLLRSGIERVQPREIIVWSWLRLCKILVSPSHLCMTLLVGGLTGFFFFLGSYLSNGLGYGLSFGLCYWCFVGIYKSVTSTAFEEHRRVVPNQGIRRSGRNGLVLGCISGVIAFVVATLNNVIYIGVNTNAGYGFQFDLGTGLSMTLQSYLGDSLVVGLCVALLAGLLYGGLAYFQHYVLRWLFWRGGSMPWRDPQFLEESVKRILLKRVGGGYSFIHPLFQDYFAALG